MLRALARYICVAVAAISLCSTAFDGVPEARAEELKIGVLVELSGQSAEQGEDCRRGLEVARAVYSPGDEVNGYHVSYHYEDTQASPKVAVSAFNRLVDVEGVQAAIIVRSPIGMALNPLSQAKHVPLLGGGVAYGEFLSGNNYAFRFWPSTQSEAKALFQEIVRRGVHRLAVMSTEDSYPLSLRDELIAASSGSSLAIVYDQQLLPTDTDLRSYVVQIKRLNPDAILVNLKPGQMGIALREIRALGLRQPLFANYFIRLKEELDLAGAAAEGTLLVEMDLDRPMFITQFKTLFAGSRLSSMSYTCYAALSSIIQTLKTRSGISSGEKLYDALREERTVRLLDETLKMTDREVEYVLRCRTISGGELAPCR